MGEKSIWTRRRPSPCLLLLLALPGSTAATTAQSGRMSYRDYVELSSIEEYQNLLTFDLAVMAWSEKRKKALGLD